MLIGEKLLQARKAAKMSRRELSEKSGVSAKAIQRYENGENEPIAGNLKKLANALDVTTDKLLGTDYASQADAVDNFLSGMEKNYNPNTDTKVGQPQRERNQEIIVYNARYLSDASLDKVAKYTQDLLKAQSYNINHADDDSPMMPPANVTRKSELKHQDADTADDNSK